MSISPAALAAVARVFERNFHEEKELGASVSIYWRGQQVFSMADGFANREKTQVWTDRTLAPVYSATKAAAAATLLHVLEMQGLNEHSRVREVWPAFPIEMASFAHLLSHQCGLAALDQGSSVWEHDSVIAAIEAQEPAWLPGNGRHGYHPRTYGFLVDECVRCILGKPLGNVWAERLALPMGWDFWIGLPESEWPRVATLVPGRAEKGDTEQGFYKEFMSAGTMTRRAFLSPTGLHAVQEMNDSKAWAAGFPAMGGLATAQGLAEFYQAAIGAVESPLSPAVQHALGALQVQGPDLVLLQQTAFTCGCQKDPVDAVGKKMRQLYGPHLSAFGHPGAGGCHAFGDPDEGISFAYVMNQMALSVMPGARSTAMVEALYGDA